MNINHDKDTIEFRLSNGTLNPDIWIENIRLYGRIVQRAQEIAEINIKMQRGDKITEQEKEKLQMKKILKSDVDMDTRMEALMGLLFEKDERETYEKRYKVNREKAEKYSIVKVMKFGKVDFKEIYEEVKKPRNIIEKLWGRRKGTSFEEKGR